MANFDLAAMALKAVCPTNDIRYDDKGLPSVKLKSRNSKSHRLSLAEQIPYILPLSSMGRKLMQSTFPSTRIL